MSSVSIKDVAEIAGVSISTVSRYVNSPDQVRAPTAKRVEEAIRKTGYEANWVARNFRTGKTEQIIVVVPSIGIPFYGPVLQGARKVAEEAGYHILVMETASNSVEFDDFTKLILSKKTDGILLFLSPFKGPTLPFNGVYPPIILGLESISPEQSDCPCVSIDNEAATRQATEYLIQLGHRDIGFVHGTIGVDSETKSTWTRERQNGFRNAMAAHDIPVNEDWVVSATMGLDGGRQCAKELLKRKSRPTALCCANDEMALAVMCELAQAGLKIPDDISIIGIDNMAYSGISIPPLTTIEQPMFQIGERSMIRLLQLIAGEKISGTEILPHKLIERQSCKPLKK